MNKNLNSFLNLGYFLGFQNNTLSIDLSGIDKEKYKDAYEAELIEIGSQIWQDSISYNFKNNQTHLVPLSGGLDSRAILAGLLEHTEAKNIYTYTFGSPKAFDYEIGNYVAKKLGTKHTSFDLTKHIYNQKELEDISKRLNHRTVLFHHWPVWELDNLFKGATQWSGFMGDPLAGSHLSRFQSTNLLQAKKNFIKKNTYVKSIKLSQDNNFNDLIESNFINEDSLTLDEQLDFQNRQIKFIAPIVLMEGYNLKTPFLYKPYIDFILSIDNKFRLNQLMYKKILINSFPKEFSYKTKINFGLPLGASKNKIFFKRLEDKFLRTLNLSRGRWVNYLDFDNKIRTKKDLRDLITSNILDLKNRDIIHWIDVENILNNHLSNKGNYSDALLVLASLEMHLKSGLKL